VNVAAARAPSRLVGRPNE